MPTLLDLCFRHRSSLVLALVVPIVTWALVAPAPTLVAVFGGATCLVLGVTLRLLAARCLGKGARVHRAGARGGLVDWGPYAWSRNPLYLAAGAILVGLGLLAGGEVWALLLLPGTCLVYTPVVLHEERVIRSSEGEAFHAYLDRVPRWLGIARSGSAGPSGEPYPWREILRRESGLVPGVLVAAAGVLGLKPLLAPWIAGVGVGWVAAGAAVGLVCAAVVNAALIQRKRTRRDARRARLAAAEAQRASAEGADATVTVG